MRPLTMEASADPIERFRIGSDQMRFGMLEFAGGLEIRASSPHFGALSGLRFTNGQTGLTAIADTGFWLTGTLQRDDANRPTGLTGVTMSEITGPQGAPFAGKWLADAEGLATDGEAILVSFEREHRITRYRRDQGEPIWLDSAPPPVSTEGLGSNGGFEGIAVGAAGSALAGALIGVSEHGPRGSDSMIGFVAPAGKAPFAFSVRRSDGFSVTDLDVLPDGDIVLLERRFGLRRGVAMRLKRVDHRSVRPGARVDGDVLLEAGTGHQIDNMEGLAITRDPDGVARLTIVSDDNHALLQRTLLIEFRLIEPQVSRAPAAADG